jgi:hypothetical protein
MLMEWYASGRPGPRCVISSPPLEHLDQSRADTAIRTRLVVLRIPAKVHRGSPAGADFITNGRRAGR